MCCIVPAVFYYASLLAAGRPGVQDSLGLELVSLSWDIHSTQTVIELIAYNDLDPWFSLSVGLSWAESHESIVLDSVKKSALAASSWDVVMLGDPLDSANKYDQYTVSYARAFAGGLEPTLVRKQLCTFYFSGETTGSLNPGILPRLKIDTITFSSSASYRAVTTGNQILKPYWMGALTTDEQLGVDEGPFKVPTAFVLHQNYPNPFNPSTEISFEITERAWVKLEIFNILGQSERVLINEVLSSGGHSVSWDSRAAAESQLGSGVYFYRLTIDGKSTTRRMVLLK